MNNIILIFNIYYICICLLSDEITNYYLERMKKEGKYNKKKVEYIFSLEDKNEIIKEIILLDETEIFNNEYNTIIEELKSTDPHIKNVILTNFLLGKLEEIEKQLKLALLAKSSNLEEIKSLINIENIEKTKDMIIDKLSAINHFDENHVIIENDYDEDVIYDLKVVYSEGSDNYPQLIKLKINKNSDYNTFVRELKKSLDIYEFAKFQIILMEKNSDFKFVYNLDDLKPNQENHIKIVPMNYIM